VSRGVVVVVVVGGGGGGGAEKSAPSCQKNSFLTALLTIR